MKINAIGIRATTLTPFAYHSLMVQGGSATLPVLISDRAIAFGLAATLGILQASVALPNKDYYRHLKAMPYRTSVFTTDKPRLLAPLIRRLNLTEEGGFPPKIQSVVKRGNLKDFFHTQEVPEGHIFTGAIFSLNHFNPFKEQEKLVIRIGLHRNGMVLLEKTDTKIPVRLNAATSALFGNELRVERYYLHNLQLSPAYSLKEAKSEIIKWQ
ncbi:MAG: hypothetical protein DRQ49_13840 [Gammaproteobacteria bacterium]|nr:MAG: hypothetical protein DRQ49_13840 [Gammaproteobacteria bacterium]RKZ40315.1 MAG: hypothetical protein DRQ41_09565 [Gammaproteobacteria bacterium]RKZ77088.1 MAG: hypothetical protein DRQ57_01165 [Gammaproteobacteria bacterium]